MTDREFEQLHFLRCSKASFGPDIKAMLLGREPRYAADRSFDTLHIKLELSVDFKKRSVAGACTTTLRPFVDGLSRLSFDAMKMRIRGARVQGRPARVRYNGSMLEIFPKRPLNSSEDAEVEIRYEIVRPGAGLHFVLPGKHNPRNPVQLWSQGQPEDSRYWFPCHDAPHEKATSEVIATVPEGFVAVSNGVLLDSHRDRARRSATFHWRMNQPHSVYLITLSVGRFAEIREQWDRIPISYYCEKGREADARRGFGKTPKAMAYFSNSLGVRYPYERYSQIAVAEYPGGMENTTATTQTDACLIDARAALDTEVDLLVAHELAHQWFGDLVTCRDWSHAWLNEGFATYFETLFTLHDKGIDEFHYELSRNRDAYFHEDEQRYRRPIVCDTYKYPWVLFDRHLYEKGGWVLHMLRYTLTDELWWKAVAHYLRKHRHRSVDTYDLIESIEEATGKNLRAFFDRWVFKAGYPSFKVRARFDRKKGRATLWVQQVQRIFDEEPAFRLPVEFRFEGRGWSRDFTRELSQKEHRLEFDLPGEPLSIEFDPNHWLLKKVDFRKSFSQWEHQLLHARTAQSRIEAARELGRWGSARAVDALKRAAARELFWGAKAEIALAAARARAPMAFPLVKSLLKDRHPKVRRAAAQALGEFKLPEAASAAAALLKREKSLHVQAEAARVLGEWCDPRYFATLKAKLREPSYLDILRSAAIEALARTRDSSMLPELLRASRPPYSYHSRAYAIRALAQLTSLSDTVVEHLGGLLDDPDERVNLAVLAALGRTDDERAIPILERVRDTSDNSRLRTYAEESLARIRGSLEPSKEASAAARRSRRS